MLAAGGLLVSGLFLMPHSLNGQEVAGAPENYQTRPSPHFKPNKGQVADHEGNLIKAYEYVYQAPGMKVGLKQNGFHYNLYTVKEKEKPHKKVSEATGKPVNGEQQKPERPGDEEAEKQTTYHYHRVEVAFKGANEDPEIIAGKQMDYYANYYLGYLPEYVTQVHGYRKLTYKNLYDNIDLVLRPETAEKGRPKLKYNIRVRPGGDLSDVKLVYKGMDKLSLEDGKLQIATSQGRLTETIPKSYWAESKQATTVNYQLEGKTVSFQAEQQQEGQTLIVDPLISWSTYLGGSSWEAGASLATDGSGSVYVSGATKSINFPTTSGTYQPSYNGEAEAFLSKFDHSGSLRYSTYLGGSNFDRSNDVTTDRSGNVYMTGQANSGFPTTNGAYQPTYGGDNGGFQSGDAFLSKFTSRGSLKYSTYMGGNSNDKGQGLATDDSGNVYLTGTAATGFPTTSGANQKSHAGNADAFLSKFTRKGGLSWSTYLGGSDKDAGLSITTDSVGNVYMTGFSRSANFPTTEGAYQTSFGSYDLYFKDAFLSKFNSNGNLSWSTFLGGRHNDEGKSIAIDDNGHILITGKTWSYNFPTTSGAHETRLIPQHSGFLSKFKINGDLSWSTYISEFPAGNGIAIDDSGNVFVVGYEPNSDGFIKRFTSRGSLSWSKSFWKINGNGNEVATARNGNVFVIGQAKANFPAIGNAYQTKYGGGSQRYADAFLVSFDFAHILQSPGFSSNSACTGDTLHFEGTLSAKSSDTTIQYKWQFQGGKIASGKSVSHVYDSAGNYLITLIVTTADGKKDTVKRVSKIYPQPKADFTFSSVDFETVTFEANDTTLSKYCWKFGDGDSAGTRDPRHVYDSSGAYEVRLLVNKANQCWDTAIKVVEMTHVGTGLDQVETGVQLKAYPNPFSRGVTLSYELPAAQSQVTLEVVDEQGKVIIRKEQGRQPAGKHTHQLQALQEASPGTYFIRLKLGGDKQQVERVVKVE